ncbi:DUF1109 domain-containing protein [Ancylobacter moscoviensis]
MTHRGAASQVGTDELVGSLAREAGRSGLGRVSLAAAIAAAVIAAVPASLALVLALVGARADLSAVLGSWIFLFKVTAMLLLASGAVSLVRAAATPGIAPKPVVMLAPAVLFLIVSALLDSSGLPLAGVRLPFSVLLCVAAIVLASLPGLVLILIVMRRGIPTRLRRAGFFAGLLAGAIGALAYTIACVNDGAAFVALWYIMAIGIVGGIGAAIGPRSLAW